MCHFCYSIPARCLSVLEGIRCSSHLILIKYRGDVKSLSVGHPRTLLGGVVHDVLHPSRCFHKLANDTFVSQVPRVVIDALFEFFPFRLLPSINNSLQFLLHVPEVFRFSHSFLWVPKLEISPPRFTNRQIDLFRKRSSSKRNLNRNKSPASATGTPTGSAQNSPKKYRGSRTSASLKVRSLLGKVWARDSKSKSCENLHVL